MDLANLPCDDPKTFEMMRNADTIGVFQIESRAQMATLPRLKPENFYDVVHRSGHHSSRADSGPFDASLSGAARRQGKVEYFHDDLKPVLERTLGVPLFQEQMLQMAMIMADFTGARSRGIAAGARAFIVPRTGWSGSSKNCALAMERKGHSLKTH